MTADIEQRKADHLDLCATDEVAFRHRTTLLECVRLVHQALPEADFDSIDTRVRLLGKELRAPLLIAAMTGGHERAGEINQALASIANELGVSFVLFDPAAAELTYGPSMLGNWPSFRSFAIWARAPAYTAGSCLPSL